VAAVVMDKALKAGADHSAGDHALQEMAPVMWATLAGKGPSAGDGNWPISDRHLVAFDLCSI
jgi:hypothetical protein